MIGRCRKSNSLCCTANGDFAYFLIRLGKQHFNGPRPTTKLEELIIEGHRDRNPYDPLKVPYVPNDVFLFDVEQLGDKNETRKALFRKDVKHFLDLKAELPDIIHVSPGRRVDEELQAKKDARKIDICRDEYIPLRRELMRISRQSSEWIRTSFLDSYGVFYSDRAFLEEILLSWNLDPCGDKSDQVTEEEVERILDETVPE